jgi:hypothetical protein
MEIFAGLERGIATAIAAMLLASEIKASRAERRYAQTRKDLTIRKIVRDAEIL